MNIEAIDATIDAIRRQHEFNVKFDMHNFYDDHCGTSCCLAGFAFIAKKQAAPVWEDESNIPSVARKFLGLTEDQAHSLFYPSSAGRHTCYASPQDGIAVLENLKATGKPDWSIIKTIDPNAYQGRIYLPYSLVANTEKTDA